MNLLFAMDRTVDDRPLPFLERPKKPPEEVLTLGGPGSGPESM